MDHLFAGVPLDMGMKTVRRKGEMLTVREIIVKMVVIVTTREAKVGMVRLKSN